MVVFTLSINIVVVENFIFLEGHFRLHAELLLFEEGIDKSQDAFVLWCDFTFKTVLFDIEAAPSSIELLNDGLRHIVISLHLRNIIFYEALSIYSVIKEELNSVSLTLDQ